MAVTKILARKGRLDIGIDYILNGDKTEQKILTAHQGCEPGRECRQMLETKRDTENMGGVQYYQMCIRDRDHVFQRGYFVQGIAGQ